MGRFNLNTVGIVLAITTPALASVGKAADLTDLSLELLLETRVISASKYEQTLTEVPAAVSVITREDIRAYGWRTLTQALTSLPGIHNSYDRQYDYLGTRGFGLPGDFNTRLLLAINGNRINDIVYDSAGLGRNFPVDLDMIERIEFIPGPGGAVYGQNAMFGVINVITRTGLQVDGWEAAVSWQQPQRMRETRVRWGGRLDNGFDLLVALSSMRARGDDLPMTFPGAAADGSDISGIARGLDGEEDDDVALHVGRGPWSFNVQYSMRSKDDPTSAYFADPLVPGQYESDDYLLSHFQYQRNVGNSWNVLGRLFTGRQRYNAEYYFGGTGNFSAGVSQWHGGELRVLNTAFNRHKLMLGVELQDNTRIDQSADDYSRGFTPAPVLFPAVASGDLLIRRDGYRTGLYVQDEWQMSASVSSSLGLRIDRNDTTGTRMSPRAALIWRATPALTLKTIYGRANRAPNSYERDYDDGIALVANPGLTRESIETTELVAESQVTRAVGVRVSVYRWKMHDLIRLSTDPVSGVPQYRAARRAVEAAGAEFSTNAAWNFGGRMRASASWQDVTYANGTALANSPQWLGRLNYTQALARGYDIGIELQYDGERKAIDGTTLDSYWLTNVNLIAAGLASGLELSLTLLNLFDAQYEHPAADNNWQTTLGQDGRAVRLRMDYRF